MLLVTLGIAFYGTRRAVARARRLRGRRAISETEIPLQVEQDIKPFRDVLLGLFFVTFGMLLDLHIVVANAWVSVLLVALILLKALLIFVLARLFRAESGVAIRVGLALSACGEFGFVILAHANYAGLLDPKVLQPVLAAMVLSMLIAPFIIERSGPIARRWSAGEWMNRAARCMTSLCARWQRRACARLWLRAQRPESRAFSRAGENSFHRAGQRPAADTEAVAAGEGVVSAMRRAAKC